MQCTGRAFAELLTASVLPRWVSARPCIPGLQASIWFAHVWGLGRVGIMRAAPDTGSAFEGMGSARETTFSTLLEPVLFLTIGTLCLSSSADTRQRLCPLTSANSELTRVRREGGRHARVSPRS
jgi:formate hydrogenlyase subunit 4